MEELKNNHETDMTGDIYAEYPPNPFQIMDKINEIIRWINEQEKTKDKA